jgi:hypothetical protein
VLPVTLLVESINELPVAIKKLIASVEEDTINLTGIVVELFVTLPY